MDHFYVEITFRRDTVATANQLEGVQMDNQTISGEAWDAAWRSRCRVEEKRLAAGDGYIKVFGMSSLIAITLEPSWLPRRKCDRLPEFVGLPAHLIEHVSTNDDRACWRIIEGKGPDFLKWLRAFLIDGDYGEGYRLETMENARRVVKQKTEGRKR